MREQQRRAFTLIELAIVIGIIAVLFAILVPVVLKGREAARRTQCANHLRQVGLAVVQHEQAKNALPGNGGWDGKQTIQAVDGTPLEVRTYDIWTSQTFHWGVGEPGRGKADQTGSWAYQILPYLDRRDVFDQRGWMTPIKIYGCPTRRPVEARVAADDQWANYFGGGWAWAKTDYAANDLVILNRPGFLSLSRITDGLPYTIVAGEKALHMPGYASGSWYWDEPYFLGGSGGTARSGERIIPDSVATDITIQRNWGSAHDAGAHFLFADGSVRLLSYETSSATLLALLSPAAHDIPKGF